MRRKHRSRLGLIFITCTLALPTVGVLTGQYPAEWNPALLLPPLMAGALLGVAHIVLRPVLRLLFAPLGCLTMGLFGLVIDLGLIYLCAAFVEGFAAPGILYALLTALLVNAVCAVFGGRH